jgi:hypothetical protein
VNERDNEKKKRNGRMMKNKERPQRMMENKGNHKE